MTMIRIRDVSLYVKIMGRGEPLVVMHGGPGLDSTTLAPFERLADRFTVILYDHRANGRSTGETASMTFGNLVADAEALRETLGYRQWAVAGHSFGGHVALEYALLHPGRIARLLLLDSAADAKWYQESAPAILEKRGYSERTVRAARRFFNGELSVGEVRPAVMRFLGAYFWKIRIRDLPAMAAAASRMKMRPEAMVQGFSVLLKRWSAMDRLVRYQCRHSFLAAARTSSFLRSIRRFSPIASRMRGSRSSSTRGTTLTKSRPGGYLRSLAIFSALRCPTRWNVQPVSPPGGTEVTMTRSVCRSDPS